MKTHTFFWLLILCIPLLVSCGNRSVSRSAQRSNLVGTSVSPTAKSERQQKSADRSKATTKRTTRNTSVAMSSSSKKITKTTEARQPITKKVTTPPAPIQPVVQPVKTVSVKEMADKPLTPVTTTSEKKGLESTTPSPPPPVEIRTPEKSLSAAQLASLNAPVQKSQEKTAPEKQSTVTTEKRPIVIPVPPKKETIQKPVNISTQKEQQVGGCPLRDAGSLNQYSVVVGSFVKPASAASLIKKLARMEIKPYFVQNEQGMYRLVTGSFDDRDDADFQALKLDIEAIESWILSK